MSDSSKVSFIYLIVFPILNVHVCPANLTRCSRSDHVKSSKKGEISLALKRRLRRHN